eukprot:SAG31_NODE_21268_length_553_cov_1.473568_1_plen_125_part_10
MRTTPTEQEVMRYSMAPDDLEEPSDLPQFSLEQEQQPSELNLHHDWNLIRKTIRTKVGRLYRRRGTYIFSVVSLILVTQLIVCITYFLSTLNAFHDDVIIKGTDDLNGTTTHGHAVILEMNKRPL